MELGGGKMPQATMLALVDSEHRSMLQVGNNGGSLGLLGCIKS